MTEPLTTDLTSMDTGFPVHERALLELKVAKVDLLPNEAKSLKLELHTTVAGKADTGEPLAPGFKIFHNVNTHPTGKATQQNIDRGAAQLVQGSGLPFKTIADLRNGHKQLEGRLLLCQVDIQPAGPDKTGVHRDARNIVTKINKAK